MTKFKVAPSILSADFSAMGEAIKQIERAGADLVHCDVMDGSFVEHPKTQIKFFAEAGADIITVHYEACAKISPTYLKETLALIKSYGVKCGAVINPDTPAERIFDVVADCDMVLVMSVFPGYGGQKFIPSSLENVKKLREYAASIGKNDLDIEIDGGVTCDNAAEIRAAGANVLVAGSAVFGACDMAAAIAKIRGGN